MTTVVTSAGKLSMPGIPRGTLASGMLAVVEAVDVLLPTTPLLAMPGKPGTAVTLVGVGGGRAAVSVKGLGGGGLPLEGGLGDARHVPVSSWHCVPMGQGPVLMYKDSIFKPDCAWA